MTKILFADVTYVAAMPCSTGSGVEQDNGIQRTVLFRIQHALIRQSDFEAGHVYIDRFEGCS